MFLSLPDLCSRMYRWFNASLSATATMSFDIGRRRYSPYGFTPALPSASTCSSVQPPVPRPCGPQGHLQHNIDFWQRLPPRLIRTLCQHNVNSLFDLQGLSTTMFQQLKRDCSLPSAVCALLDALHTNNSLTPLQFIRLWLQIPKDGSCTQLHQVLGTQVQPSQVRRAGPTPSANIYIFATAGS